MDINKIFESKMFKWIILGILLLIVLLAVFKLGIFIGTRKADFSCGWGDNYHRNFGGPRGGFMRGFGDREFIDANGTFGQIIKIDGSILIVKGNNDVEKIVLINDKTIINRFNETIKVADLKVEDSIVVIGEPNQQGQITAKLIRLMPVQSAPEQSPVPPQQPLPAQPN